MKGKKLISLLCAAAMTTSAFASMAVTASAATDLFTYTDGATSLWTNNNATLEQKKDEDDASDTYFQATGNGSGNRSATYALPTVAQLSDDYVIEFDSYIHGANGMGRESQTTQIAFYGANKATDTRTAWVKDTNTGEGVGTGFAVKYDVRRSYASAGIIVNDDCTALPTATNEDGTELDWTGEDNFVAGTVDKWTRTQAVISGGKATITMIDGNGNKLIDGVEYDCDATTLVGIQVSCARGDNSDYGFVMLDNVHIYEGEAEALTAHGLKGGEVTIATPKPAPETIAGVAPSLTAPEGAGNVLSANFESEITGTSISLETAAQNALSLANGGLNISIGNRDTGADSESYGSIVKVKGGSKALKLAGGAYSTDNRGPILNLTDDLDIDENTSVLGFAVYLSNAVPNGKERIYLVDTTEKSNGTDGHGYRDVLAVITTEENADYTVGSWNRGISVSADEWHTVVVTVSSDKYRVFIDGHYYNEEARKLEAALDANTVHYGDTARTVTNLPSIAIENGGSATRSLALIDNVVAYQVDEVSVANLPTVGADVAPFEEHSVKVEQDTTNLQKITVTSTDEGDESFDGVLIHAAYNTANQLVGIKTYDLTESKTITKAGTEIEIPAEDTVHTGDKIMVWNSVDGMLPYGLLTVEAGAAQPTLEPTEAPTATPTLEPTATPTLEPTATPTLEPTATPTLEPTATPTQEPVADPTATPTTGPVVPTTYAITSAPATNGSFVINGANNGSAAAGAMITVVPNADSGYELDTITVTPTNTESETTVPVSAVGTFTMPAEAVTVTVTFKAETVVPTTYTVTLAAGEGGSFAEGAKTSFTVNENGTLASETITEPTKEGYTFAGWVKGTDVAITTEALKAVQITGDVTYTATYTENGPAEGIYEYSYQANGVTIPLFVLVK